MCCLWNHHIRALLARNFIYRKRSWISSLIQLLLPCATILILVGIKVSLKDDDYFKPTVIPDFYPSDAIQPLGFLDYLTAVQVPRKCETLTVDLVGGWSEYYKLRKDGIKYLISDINPSRWPVPFVKCDARRCKENGQSAFDLCEYNILAVAPTNEISKEDVVSFEKYVKSTYPMLDDIQQKLGYELVQTQFQSSDEIDQYVQHPEYGKVGRPKVALAIILGRSGKQYQYTLRTNSTNVNSQEIAGRPVQPTQPSTLKLFDDYAKVAKRSCELQGGVRIGAANEDNCVVQYIYNGALTIQRLVNDWIIDDSGAKAAGSFISENGVSFADFPSFEYIRDGFYAQIAPYAPLLIVLGLLFSVSSSIKSIVSEKELRQKELMKMMSISEFAIGCSWFLSTYAFFFIMGILTTICTKFVYAKANFFALLLFWELSYLSIVTLILTVSAIFYKATRASLVGILVFFIGYFFTLIEDIEDGRRGIVLLLSIHPVTATSYGLQMIGLLEDKGVGLRRSSFQFSDFPSRYSFSRCVSMLVFDIFLWGFLSWYLNRVVPGDYGQAEPWYFPCLKSYWCGVKKSEWTETSHSDDEVSSDVPKEQVSNALKEQEKDGKGVHIKGLTKMFGDKTAVDNLNLSMYSGQVFVLLGHNGAGKTTTINMLTGMISPTSGNAMIAGKNIKTQLSEARKSVGICLQHDCLFPMLTVKEHVQFFCRVKGVYGSMSYEQAEASVKSAIEDVALLDKKNTYAKNLSGGMKRKLSLAIAFCGDSKVVFLDEPTAGMDPFSRRFTWNVIRQNREDRCIILTTHFMDEADLLGDRIAIMAEGQLRCVGSSIFLKKKYGVGYNITIEKASKKER
jgi:ABC-type multidrug transport system ATPase subunit